MISPRIENRDRIGKDRAVAVHLQRGPEPNRNEKNGPYKPGAHGERSQSRAVAVRDRLSRVPHVVHARRIGLRVGHLAIRSAVPVRQDTLTMREYFATTQMESIDAGGRRLTLLRRTAPVDREGQEF